MTAVFGSGNQEHVRLLDLLEAADRRAVEAGAFLEAVQGQLVRGHRVVLHRAGQVGEPKIDDLDALGLDQAQDLFRRALGECHLTSYLRRGGSARCRRLQVLQTEPARHVAAVVLRVSCELCGTPAGPGTAGLAGSYSDLSMT